MINLSSSKVRIAAFLMLLLISYGLIPFIVGRAFAVVDNFTHAVLDENFGWLSWAGCQADEPSHLAKYEKYKTYEPDIIHGLHIVSFHYRGPFTNTKAQERWSFYSLQGAPSNVYDGHYNYTYYINEDAINSSGTRQIHMLEMSLSKSIEGSTLSFSGSVKNLESHIFSGFVLVFVTENQLIDPSYPTITWNFVFRAYGLNKTLILAGLSTDTFNGTWNIPIGVNAANIQVIAATYDNDTREPTYEWPYAVQSVCDVCRRSIAMPAFLTTDLNKDGTVNLRDLFIVAKAYGSHGPGIPNPGDPPSQNWNAVADVNKDGWVNLQDIYRIARDYGKTT